MQLMSAAAKTKHDISFNRIATSKQLHPDESMGMGTEGGSNDATVNQSD